MACVSGEIDLDDKDRRILAILDDNARTSATEIGRRIGLSRTAIQDRLSKLEADGVIKGYRVEIAQTKDELIRAVLFVKIAVRPCNRALEWMASLEGVQEVISLSGEIDCLIKCTAPDVASLTALNDQIGSSHLISSSTSNLVLSVAR